MRETIQDRKFLESIQPETLVQYLSQQGWRKESKFNQIAEIWVLSDPETGSEYEILVPLSNKPEDYDLRIADILEILEIAEARSQAQIIRALQANGNSAVEPKLGPVISAVDWKGGSHVTLT